MGENEIADKSVSQPAASSGIQRLPPRERIPGGMTFISHVPRIYLEDVEEIFDVINRYSEEKNKIQMATNEFSVSSPEKLRELPQEKIMMLNIISLDPYVNVVLEPRSSHVWIRTDDERTKKLARELIRVIEKRRVRFLSYYGWIFASLIVSFLPILLLISGIFGVKGGPLYLIVVVPLFLALLVWLAASVLGNEKNGVVVPVYKKEAPKPWYLSNELKIAILSSVITSIITALATIAFTRK